MTKPQVTDWFPASVKPVHVGPYRVDPWCGRSYYSWWCGRKFHGCWDNPKQAEAAKRLDSPGFSPVTKWRGLTAKAD